MIEIQNLCKSYGTTRALADVTFEVPAGQIVGFLGPNGAGKSTCLRILTGLVHADAGTATIAGQGYGELPNPARVIGSMLDAESFHGGRSGRESLRMAAITLGLPLTRVDEVLAEVGLSPREARRRVGSYSMGMRQRLGIAQALLSKPSALVLDEPTNGLDPQGQRWLTDLLRSRAEQGCAVLFSSHQLHDVARLAHSVVMIGHGRVLDRQQTDDIDDLEARYFELTAGTDRAA